MKMSKNSIFGHFWPFLSIFGQKPGLGLKKKGPKINRKLHILAKTPKKPVKKGPKSGNLALLDPSNGHFGPLEGSKSAILR